MISRTELRRIARARLRDAEVLFGAGRYDGAIYVCGYAIELTLKARICRVMSTFVEKLKAIEGEIARERGRFALFALFEREELPGRWDVVFSAPWVGESRRSAIDYLVGKSRTALDSEEFLSIARFVPLRPAEDFVRALTQTVHVEHGLVELHNEVVNGLFVTHGYVITSQPGNQPLLETEKMAT